MQRNNFQPNQENQTLHQQGGAQIEDEGQNNQQGKYKYFVRLGCFFISS